MLCLHAFGVGGQDGEAQRRMSAGRVCVCECVCMCAVWDLLSENSVGVLSGAQKCSCKDLAADLHDDTFSIRCKVK